MQKDMKIGMLAGLVLAVGVMFYVCTRPAFGPRARILGKENLDREDEQQEQIEQLVTFGPATASAKASAATERGQKAPAALEREKAPAATEREQKAPAATEREKASAALEREKPRFVQKLPSFEEEIEQEQTKAIPEPVIAKSPQPVVEEPPVPQYIARKFYIVRKGDTLSKISQKYYGDANKWYAIYEANRDIISNPNRIQIGMKLYIPD